MNFTADMVTYISHMDKSYLAVFSLRKKLISSAASNLRHRFEARTDQASRPGPETGPGQSKNLPGSWPDKPRSTRVNPTEIRLPSFFFVLYRFKRLCCLLLYNSAAVLFVFFIYLITQLQFSQAFIRID